MSRKHIRGVINKFVDNLCHFFNNPPMEIMFDYKTVWLISYELGKNFSDIFRNVLAIVAMGTDSTAGQNRSVNATNI